MFTGVRNWVIRQAIKAMGAQWPRVLDLNAGHEQPEWTNLSKYTQQADIYARSSWVFIAVSKIAQACAQADLEIMAVNADGEDQEVEDSPIELLLEKPNAWQSQIELFEQTFGFLKLTGNAYWFLSGSGVQPDQIMILRPDRVRIAAGKDTSNLVAGYIYDVDGIQVPLDPAEVIHFKLFNPLSDYYGLSPLEAAALATTNDLSMQRWNRNFFGKRNATPSGLVNIKRPMTQDQYEQLKRDWLESVGGENRATMFLRGEDISWQEVAQSQRDMEFVAGRKFSRDEIFMIYGIPSGMMDANSTEANAKTARDTFLSDTVWPELRRFTAKLTAELAPFFGDGLCIEAEDVRPKDRAFELNEFTQQAQYLSLNENRAKLKLEPYPDPEADVPLILRKQAAPAFGLPQPGNNNQDRQQPPDQQKPMDMQRQPQQDMQNQDGQDAGDGEDMPMMKTVEITRATLRELAQFERYAGKGKDIDRFTFEATPIPVQLAVKALADCGQYDLITEKALSDAGVDHNRLQAEQKIADAMGRYFDGLKSRLVEGVRHVDSPATGKALPDLTRFMSYFDKTFWRNELDKMAGVMQPLIQDAIERGAIDQADALYMSTGIASDPSVFNPKAAQFAADWIDQILADFGTTTQQGTGAILQRYVAQGDATLNDLINALQQSGLYSRQRARIVGVTENTRAVGMGNYLAGEELARQAGVTPLVDVAQFGRLLPAHPYCRCNTQAMFTYDADGNITGLDYIWSTANDEKVCAICWPRNQKAMSTLL